MKPFTFNVLSVDWDYFLPCIDGYDWGHREDLALMFESIWTFRAYEREMCDYSEEDPPRAIHKIRVDKPLLESFLSSVLTKDRMRNVLKLYVCESHAGIWTLMRSIREQVSGAVFNVWNIDAHHDWNYGHTPQVGEEPDCGNWACAGKQSGLIHQYHLIYPEWRKEEPEGNFEDVAPHLDSVPYGIGGAIPWAILPNFFAFAFFCRSGVWTPSWEDAHWMRLLERIQGVMPRPWKEKAYSELSLTPPPLERRRSPRIPSTLDNNQEAGSRAA